METIAENSVNTEIYNLVARVGALLKEKHLFVVTAESCTGGLLAKYLTDVPGSSAYFERGFVTYSNLAKHEVLDVGTRTLETFGAVSEEVAQKMAEGALKHSHSQIGIAITGIAGPDGGTKDKPVGTVCFAITRLNEQTKTFRKIFKGDRDYIRIQAVEYILKQLLTIIRV